MSKLGFVVFLAAVAFMEPWGSLAYSASQYATYKNARYGYVIDFPLALLLPQPESDNGDGRMFKARAGKASFSVYGGHNAMGDSSEALAQQAEADCPEHHAGYRVVKPTLIAISCETFTDIIYQKTLIRGDMLSTLYARYPKAERSKWDPVVTQMARSLTPSHSD